MGIEAELIRFGTFTGLATSNLNAHWRNIDYCAIDVETTGLNLKDDEIISIGAVQIHKGRIKAENNYYREVLPSRLPSIPSVRIHGLRGIDLDSVAPINSVIPEFVVQVRGRVLIAHAAWIEYAFLKGHLRGAGLSFSKKIMDTAVLARALGYGAGINDREPSLESLARSRHLPVYAPHNALGDALTTAVVFLALATELEQDQLAKGESALSLRTLLKVCTKNLRK